MKKILIVAACITGSTLQAQIVAQSRSLSGHDDSTKTLNPVNITAVKFPVKQDRTGKVVTIISKEQIEKNQGRNVAQLLNEQAGITVNGALNDPGTNPTVYLRGASSGRTLILLDGIPVNDPSMINNEFDLNLVSLNDVERIEICRGAQSTLYGSDAIGGVINIITRNNDVKGPLNFVSSLSAGNYGTYRGNVRLYGKTGKLSYSAGYSKYYSNGFSSANDSTGKKQFENDSYNKDAFIASLQFQAGKSFLLKYFFQYTHYAADLDPSVFTDEKDFTAKNKDLLTGIGFVYKKNKFSFTGNYQLSNNHRDYLDDSTDVPGSLKYSADKYFGRTHFVELYATFESGRFIYIAGADFRTGTMSDHFYSLSIFPRGPYNPYLSDFSDSTHSQTSVYASLLYHSKNEKLNVEVGGRLNFHSQYGSNATFTFNPSYNIDKHFRIFGSVARGFKAPTLYQLYSSFGNRNLKPERSLAFEAGVQQQDEKIQNRIVYFHRDIINGIDFDNINFTYFNYVKQTVDGIELESQFEPVKNFILSANFTWLHSSEKTQSRVTFKDTSYKYLLRRPEHQLNISASYSVKEFYFSISGKYVSKRYDVGGYQVKDVLLKDYFILNGYSEYKATKWLKLFLNAQNILDKKFFDLRGYNSIPFLISGGVIINL